MGRPRKDRFNIGFTLTAEQAEWLKERADDEDRSMSSVIRRLIEQERKGNASG